MPLFYVKEYKQMKVTVEDILKIRRGRSKTFALERPSECHSLVSLVGYVKKIRRPSEVSNYKTTTDWDANTVTVTAL